jgi:biotin transport system substrate-specific component
MKDELAVQARSWSKTEGIALRALGAIALACLTILGAQVRIPLPFTPVPMTLQTFVVPLAGGFLGTFWGGASMLLYLVLGLTGLNVFAAASTGLGFFLAPTAGYLIGYFFAATLVGFTRDHFRSNGILLAALILSHIVIYSCGVLGLSWNAGMTGPEAFAKGVAPFLVGDTIKIAASYLVLLSARKLY